MLQREVKDGSLASVFVDKEFVIEAKGEMKTIIPYSSSWKTLLIQVSGGLDSALLLFLTANLLKENGSSVKILPFSLEVPTKAKALDSARRIISTVKELTGYQFFAESFEYEIPFEKSTYKRKDDAFLTQLRRLYHENAFCFEFNGNTRNPPASARCDFLRDFTRESFRDHRTSIYNGAESASPHAMIDKSGIVYLYKKFGILDSLASQTVSCDANIEDVAAHNLDIPCGECWWCEERAWGFRENNIIDPAINH